jgi:hypothetical protein
MKIEFTKNLARQAKPTSEGGIGAKKRNGRKVLVKKCSLTGI